MDATTGFAALLAVTVAYALARWFGRNETVRGRLTCPRTGAVADVAVVQRYAQPDEPVRVAACSLLPRPDHVDCGQDCLRCRSPAWPRRSC